MSVIKDIFVRKEPDYAIMHISKQKWLDGVTVKKDENAFRVKLWNTSQLTVMCRDKFKSTYTLKGSYNKKLLNMLGESKIDYTERIGYLEVNQCFSLSKSILLNRIERLGQNGVLYSRYEDSLDNYIIMFTRDDTVVLQSIVPVKNEIIINDIQISTETGPDCISKIYGKPDTRLKLERGKTYDIDKGARISGIRFTWGDKSTKFTIELKFDVESRIMTVEIVVK